jgi:PadR family transcriptional regulator PadR
MAYEGLVRKLTVENLWLYILSLLKEAPRYGYEIREQLAKRFGFKPNEVTVYAVLFRLKRGGYIALQEVKESKEGPKRKYYALTPKGEEALGKARRFIEESYERLFGAIQTPGQ